MKRKYGAVSLALVLSVLVAVLAAVAVGKVVNAITFEPTLKASVSDPAAGANADVITDYNIPKGNAQFLAQVTFTPAEFVVANDADIPNGALVGRLEALATLGLINQACNSALPVTFDSLTPGAGKGMMDASTDTSVTVTFDEQFQDADGNTLPDGVDKFPDFINRMFPGAKPVARQFGQASVAGSPVSLSFVVFEPGSTLPILGTLDPALGYPSVTVLNNNGDPEAVASPNPITDFCTPLTTVIITYAVSKDNPDTAADESGKTVRTNPAAGGTYTFTAHSVSQYDADDDNIENGLDTCAYDKNVGDPFTAGAGDQDGDGLDDVCDPEPTVANTDQDGDAYMNRGDNCPLVANGADPDNQKDKDADSIGDACDKNPDTPDGTPVDAVLTADVVITGGAAAASPTAAAASPTKTAVASPTKTAVATPTKTAVATPTKTAVASPTAVPSAVPPEPGGGGLLEEEEGFPTWAFFVIGVAAVLLLGGLGTAVTVVRRRGK